MRGGFNPATTWSVLDRLGVTNFTAAPTVYRALRTSGDTPKGLRLRCASSAGEPLTPEVTEWTRRELGVHVRDHFGQTELGMVHVLEDEHVGPRAVGRIAVDVEHSPLLTFEGYQDGEGGDKFTRGQGAYLTGDLGHMDEDGDFFFASRDDDVILMAGYRIGPFDIESVLLQHPQVAECAAIGAPDEGRGEVLEVYVVPRPGTTGTPELASELQQWVKRRYAAHAYPRTVHFIEALPKTPSGKIQRNVLRRERAALNNA